MAAQLPLYFTPWSMVI